MGCGSTTLKYLLFFFNLIFALAGAALAAIAAIVYWNDSYYDDFFGSYMDIPAIILMSVGAIIFVISFFGCFGAIRESQCSLITFAVLLSAIFVLQVTGATLAFVYVDSVDSVLRTEMKDLMLLYNTNTNAKKTWDAVQTGFECCGVEGSSDWLVSPPAGPGLGAPPPSCACDSAVPNCANNLFAAGCYDPVQDFFQMILYILGGAAIGIALIELIGIIFSCILASSFKNKKNRYGLMG